jgi:hypothetical protein
MNFRVHSRWPWVAGLLFAFGVMSSPLVAQPQPERFPHAKHEKLFPQCSGCHAGIATGVAATAFPDTATCGECHNNRDKKKVRWTAPVRTVTNLKFSHPDHRSLTDGDGSACTTCHATTGAKWMHVDRATPAQCLGCHTHKATAHLAPDNRCATCHVPLTKAVGLTAARIGAFPKPASHEARDFAARHDVVGDAAQAQCATCHARESCARCHVNATKITNRFQLGPDARVASLVAGKPAVYTAPTSHSSSTFLQAHGPSARANGASCANCHARASCQNCHTGTGAADALAQIPIAESGGAAGVQLTNGALPWKLTANDVVPMGRVALGPARSSQPPARVTTEPHRAVVHPAGFARTHGVQAAVARPTCDGCHARSYCAECHAGESSRKFHVPNFAARHAPEAWGRETDCQQCHSREVFCRGCHLQVGLSSKGRSNVGYHSAIPLWPLQHGQAARQGLQSCTSCHTQKDCMQCHAQGGRGINPHGPGFDAQRMWKANRLTCLRCHLKDPMTDR